MTKKKIYIAIGSALVFLVILLVSGILFKDKGDSKFGGPVYEVKRGPLTISFVESGTIKAKEQIIIKNEVEGKTSIISLVPEGTRVKKGDLLIELDASAMTDQKINQEITVQNGEATYVGAKENLAVVENQAKSDVDLATLKLEFAKQDLEKYIQGEYPYEIDKADAEIILAQQEHVQAEDKLKWSLALYEDDYISETELEQDKLDEQKKKLNVQLAQKSKELLAGYTYKRQLDQLKSDVSQAEMALERVERKAKADTVQAQADLKAKESEFLRQKDKLQKYEDQIKKTKIYAPADGLVIYATSGQGGRHSVEPLDEGQDVQERQELIYLPVGNLSRADIAIHESNLDKIKIGLPAIITVDALVGTTFSGTIEKIAPLPDAQSMWMNPDLKVYNSEIDIDGNSDLLRSGMGCQAEIIVQQYKDAVSVPIQAVTRIGHEPAVYVQVGNSFEPRIVKTGLDNNKMIHVIEGLEAGEVVLLSPPLKSGSVNSEDNNNMGTSSSADKIQSKISERLDNLKTKAVVAETDKSGDKVLLKKEEKPGAENIDAEKMAEMKKKFDKMSPEEKEKMRKQWQK